MRKILTLICIMSFFGCNLVNTISFGEGSSYPCSTEDIEIIKDDDCCKIEDNGWLCDVLEAPEITYLDETSYDMLPNICGDIGSSFTFSSNGQQTHFNILDKGHHIIHHAPSVICHGTHDDRVYIIQKNEIAYLDLQNDLFGTDPIHLELKSTIQSYSDETPGDKEDFFILYHPDVESNIAHFYKRYKIGENKDVDYWSRTFHQSLELDGETYQSVTEFKVAVNVRAEPHTRMYVSDKLGWFAFEKDNKLWIRD